MQPWRANNGRTARLHATAEGLLKPDETSKVVDASKDSLSAFICDDTA
jgi:hypothetical protein